MKKIKLKGFEVGGMVVHCHDVKDLEKEKKTIMDGWYHDNETIKSLLDKANDRILLAVEAIQLTPDNWKNKKMIEFLQSLGEGWDE